MSDNIEEVYIGKDKMFLVNGRLYKTIEEALKSMGNKTTKPKSGKSFEFVARAVKDKVPGIMRSASNFMFPYPRNSDYCPTCGEEYKKKICRNCDTSKPKKKEKEENSRDIAYERYTSGYISPLERYDRMADDLRERYYGK